MITVVAVVGVIVAIAVVSMAMVFLRRRTADRRLGYLAQYDQLTGLINRTLFQDRLNSALARARREGGLVTVMFLDIDGFKEVNDRFGHAVGDELLRQVAERLVSCLRETDTIARLGGDEFTVVLEGGKRVEDAGQVAMKILQAISQPYTIGKREVVITTSIGIAVYPIDGDSYEELVKGADTAMYQSKAAGRNTYQYFTRALRDRTTDRMGLLEEFKEAIADGDQFRLEYQPKVDVARGVVIGLEAFIRWDHPTRGLLMPGDFIPLAEETDLIVPMSTWLIEEACLDMYRWAREGLRRMRVAINASERLLRDANLVDMVTIALHAADLDPRHLEVEVTERMITQEPERAARAIERLSDMGVKVSIDDFGTGYSSIKDLQSLPIRALKIDDSFVRNAQRRPEAQQIIEAIIAIAASFDLDVIAEGVESQEELSVVRSLGCNQAQGYLIAKPLPPDEVLGFIAGYDKTLSFNRDAD